MTTDLAQLETAEIAAEMTLEQVADVLMRLDLMSRRIKQESARLWDEMEKYVSRNGPVEIGEIRYYIGSPKKTSCPDQCEALQALIEKYGPEHVARNFLGSGALKYGAIREEDPEMFERLFVVEEVPELKEGKPTKKLQKVDTKYLK